MFKCYITKCYYYMSLIIEMQQVLMLLIKDLQYIITANDAYSCQRIMRQEYVRVSLVSPFFII